jgi:hypothetical protein
MNKFKHKRVTKIYMSLQQFKDMPYNFTLAMLWFRYKLDIIIDEVFK